MFSIATTEIRWFFPGRIPDHLYDWHNNKKGLFENQHPRTDVYLFLPDQNNLGIKLREGRIEFKKRLSIHDDYLVSGLSGNVETWIKWSIKVEDDLDPFNHLFDDSSNWVKIRKKRYLQKYKIIENHKFVAHPRGIFPQEGLALELSELDINDQPCWTLGLESYGNPENVYINLSLAIPLLIGDIPNIRLTKKQSFGYPEWIGTL